MDWFLQHVYPRIQAQVPSVHLTITGDHGDRPLPTARGVTLTGFVEDVRPVVAAASVSLAPILTGGGTRLKILEAMALGTPVVSTGKGAEGLAVKDGVHLMLADDPAEFANAVVHLLNGPQASQALAADARRLVGERYNWQSVMPRFLDLLDAVIERGNLTSLDRRPFNNTRAKQVA
jgi:glycosyltransferase involved in cell wall biosynthesis